MPTTEPTLHTGLTHLLQWLTRHPHIPITYVSVFDDATADLVARAGLWESLTLAADAADALTNAKIDITDNRHHQRLTHLYITGTTPGPPDADLLVTVEVGVYDRARTALLASLGPPPNPHMRVWHTTAAHLRTLVAPDVAP